MDAAVRALVAVRPLALAERRVDGRGGARGVCARIRRVRYLTNTLPLSLHLPPFVRSCLRWRRWLPICAPVWMVASVFLTLRII